MKDLFLLLICNRDYPSPGWEWIVEKDIEVHIKKASTDRSYIIKIIKVRESDIVYELGLGKSRKYRMYPIK